MNKRVKKKINKIDYKLRKLKLKNDDILVINFDTKVINLSTAKSYLDSIASIVDNKVIATINVIDIKSMTTEELIHLRDTINNILEVKL